MIGMPSRDIQNQISLETKRQSLGVVPFIYNPLTRSVWMIEEKITKSATCKRAGELSFPAETRKVGEGPQENLLGSLAEVFDDTHSKQFGENLHLGYYYQNAFHLGNNPNIPVDVALFIYDGDLIVPTPVVTDEVGPFGWIPIDQVEKLPLRSVALQVLNFVKKDDKLDQVEQTYHMHKTIRRQLRQEYFSIAAFHTLREEKPDVQVRQEIIN